LRKPVLILNLRVDDDVNFSFCSRRTRSPARAINIANSFQTI